MSRAPDSPRNVRSRPGQPPRGGLHGPQDRTGGSAKLGPVVRRTLDIPSLDGLRAVAVGIVILSHLQLVFLHGTSEAVPAALGPLAGVLSLARGSFGVTVFFFLSGYLITTLLRMEAEATGGVSLPHFYLRRTLRIFPPFYLVLIAGLLLTDAGFISGWHLDPAGVLSQLFYVSNYYQAASYPHFGAAAGTWVFWSLAVEEHFYLLFPLGYLLLQRLVPSRGRRASVLLGACAVVRAWRCVLVFGFHVSDDRTFMATDTRIDSILFGCALAVYENPHLDRSRIDEATWKFLLLPIGLAGLLASLLVTGDRTQQTVTYTIQGICLVPVFVGAVRYSHWLLFRPLQWPWVRFLGVVSYVIYLVHATVIITVQQVDHV